MFDSHSEALLADAVVIWLTTVSGDGQPQASPVWYVRDGGEFLIYSRPTAARLSNIAANPRVALNLDSDEGGDVVTIEGAARVVDGPSSLEHRGYQDKYAKRIRAIGYTPEDFAADYSVALRVVPQRVRTH